MVDARWKLGPMAQWSKQFTVSDSARYGAHRFFGVLVDRYKFQDVLLAWVKFDNHLNVHQPGENDSRIMFFSEGLKPPTSFRMFVVLISCLLYTKSEHFYGCSTSWSFGTLVNWQSLRIYEYHKMKEVLVQKG